MEILSKSAEEEGGVLPKLEQSNLGQHLTEGTSGRKKIGRDSKANRRPADRGHTRKKSQAKNRYQGGGRLKLLAVDDQKGSL